LSPGNAQACREFDPRDSACASGDLSPLRMARVHRRDQHRNHRTPTMAELSTRRWRKIKATTPIEGEEDAMMARRR